MPTVNCSECEEEIYVEESLEQGEIISCDECGDDLKVVGVSPVELTLYDDEDEPTKTEVINLDV